MQRRTSFWMLSVGGALMAAAGLSTSLQAQVSLPSIGGGSPGGAIGPGIGPGVGPINPAAPNVPGVGPVQPGGKSGVLPQGPKNAVPNTVERAGNAANNATNRTTNNNNLVGPEVPLTISGVPGAPNARPLGAAIDSRNGRLIVRRVDANGLLESAGVQPGDQLLAVDRGWVRSMGDLSSRLSAVAESGGTAVLYLDRNGAKQWLNVDFSSNTRPKLGIQMQEGKAGVTVDAVTVNSAAAEAGLQAGDRIFAVNGNTIQTAADVTAQVAAALAADGELDLQVIRDGAQQTLHAKLEQTRDAVGNLNNQVGATVGNVRQTVGNLRSDVDQLASNVNDQVRADVDRVRTLAGNLEQRVADVRDDASQLAQDRVQQVRGDLEQLRTSLTGIVDRTQGAVHDTAEHALNQVKDLERRLQATAQNTVGNAQDRARQTTDSVRDRVASVRDRLSQVVNQTEENARNQVGQVRDRVATLHDRIDQLAGRAQGLTRQEVENLRDDAAGIKARLDDFADRINDSARGEVNELRDEIVALRHDLRDLVSDQTDLTAQAAADLRAGVTSDVNAVAADLTSLSGQVKGDAQAEVQLVAEAAARLRDDLGGLNAGPDAGDRLASLRDRIADLRGRLGDLTDRDDGNLGEQVHTQVQNIRDRLAIDGDRLAELRDRLNGDGQGRVPSDVARNAVERTAALRSDIVQRTESIRDRLNDVNAIENLKDADGQSIVQAVQTRLNGIRENLSGDGDDDGRLDALRDDAAALRARANDLVRNVGDKTGDDSESLYELRARLRTLAGDLHDYVADRRSAGAPQPFQAAGAAASQKR